MTSRWKSWKNLDNLIRKERVFSADSSNFVVQENNVFSVFYSRGSFCRVLESRYDVNEPFEERLVGNVFSKDMREINGHWIDCLGWTLGQKLRPVNVLSCCDLSFNDVFQKRSLPVVVKLSSMIRQQNRFECPYPMPIDIDWVPANKKYNLWVE